jgi:signal peptidase II
MAPGTGRRRRRIGVVLAVTAVVEAADQATKTWAERRLATRSIEVVWTLRLRLTLNPGIAFSIGRGSTGLVTVVALLILVAVGVVAWRSSGRLLGLCLGLIMGGALGNLTDRLVRGNGGRVIDFIDLRWFPVFNVADAAVSCGVALVLLTSVAFDPDARRHAASPPAR